MYTYGSKWIRPDKRLAIYIRDDFECAYCGAALKGAAPAEVTLDHLLPRSAGGTNDATNLITACRSCNSSRGARPWIDYAPGGARDRIEQHRREPLNLALARAIISQSSLVAPVIRRVRQHANDYSTSPATRETLLLVVRERR